MAQNLLQNSPPSAALPWTDAAGRSGLGAAPTGAVVQTEQVKVELLAHAPQGLAPGRPFWLGVRFTHSPKWHTYWKNAGDSGQPPSLAWSLPAGLTAGEILWPVPKKIPVANLANYGFDGTVLLVVPVRVDPSFKPVGANLRVDLRADWLVCREECVPQDGNLRLEVPLAGSSAAHAAEFDAALAAQPQALAGPVQLRLQGAALELSVTGLPADWQGQTLAFFPETPEVIETAADLSAHWTQGRWVARIPLARQRGASPAELPFWLVRESGGPRLALAGRAPVEGVWPAVGTYGQTDTADLTPSVASPATAGGAGAALGWWGALLGAFVGGLILNLMPCVFPVLAIKVVGFARHAHHLRVQRQAALAYAAGVVGTFVALAAALLALRAAGAGLGWGFQLQSPAVVAALATLFALIAFNLWGLFEFKLGLPGGLGGLQLRHPLADGLASGVLAVLVASPCSAPFMGASLGLALSLPATQALSIFASLGLGMALPYVALAWWPALARRMPRPGPWMQRLRQGLAFPMAGTVIWLLWVLGQQVGVDGAASLLAALLGLAALLWALGLRGRSRIVLAGALGLVLLAWLSGPARLVLQEPPPAPTASTAGATPLWQAWSAQVVQTELAAGHTVFVDFTAAWCITCQVNKRTTLSNPAVLADFAAHRVTLLRADWTRRDPAITAALAQLGRSGVPVYALYAPGQTTQVLTELILPADIHAALARLGPQTAASAPAARAN